MNFDQYVNMLHESFVASEMELSNTLKDYHKKILNLYKKMKKAGYNDAAPEEVDGLDNLLIGAIREYKDFVNSHMDTILLYPNIETMYKAFNEVLKTIRVLTTESTETGSLVKTLKHIINRIEFNSKICNKFLSGKRSYNDDPGVYAGAHKNVNHWLQQYNQFKEQYILTIKQSLELQNMLTAFEKHHQGFFM